MNERNFWDDNSLIDLIKRAHPDLFTRLMRPLEEIAKSLDKNPEMSRTGTTIIAAKYSDGVVIGADRRASSGYHIADERTQKIHQVDLFTVIGAAGTSKICQEVAKMLKAELEFYEKIRGREMSFMAKISRLGYLTSLNLRGYHLGLIAVPVLAGFDKERNAGRIFTFDVIGSPSEAEKYASQGSGTISTTGSLPMLYEDEPGQVSLEEVTRRILKVLKQVIATDMGTGFDPARGIWPTLKAITQKGTEDLPERDLKTIWENL